MSTTKLMKTVRRSIRAEGLEVVSAANRKGHLVFEVLHERGRLQRLVVAGTPRVPEESADKALREVRRFAREG